MDEKRTQFDYLLNAFERASQSDRPADLDYAGKRRALYAYVRDLEKRAAPSPAADAVSEAALVEALKAIFQYGADTLSGRGDGGPDGRDWYRVAVLEMTRRAQAALAARGK